MSKDYSDPLDLLALASAGLLDATELDAAEAALSDSPGLADRVENAWEALNDASVDPALPAGGWKLLDAALDAQVAREPEPEPGPAIVISLACTYCHDSLVRNAARYCGSCLAPHHRECFAAHGHCAAPGCSEVHTVRALHEPVAAPTKRPRWRRAGLAAAGFVVLSGSLAAWSGLREQVAVEAQIGLGPAGSVSAAPPAPRPAKSVPVAESPPAPEVESRRGAEWIERGLRAEGLGRWQKALEIYRAELEVNPGDSFVHVAIARLYTRMDRLEDARKSYETAIKRGRGRLSPLEGSQVRLEVAHVCAADLLYEAARKHLNEISQTLTGDAASSGDAWAALVSDVEQLRFELTVYEADGIVGGHDETEQAANALARQLDLVAEGTCSEGGPFDPVRWRVALNFALRTEQRDPIEELVAGGVRECTEKEDRAWAYGARAFFNLYYRRNLTAARSDAEVALRLDPDSLLAMTVSGHFDPRSGEARRTVQQARNLAVGNGNEVGHYYREGLRWTEFVEQTGWERNALRAERAFRRALQLHPLHADSLLGRARLFKVLNDRDRELACLQRAKLLDPASGGVHTKLGEWYLRVAPEPGALTAARGAFDQAIAFYAPDVAIDALIGRAHAALLEAKFLRAESPWVYGTIVLKNGERIEGRRYLSPETQDWTVLVPDSDAPLVVKGEDVAELSVDELEDVSGRASELVAMARKDLEEAVRSCRERYPAAAAAEVQQAIRSQRALRDLCRAHGPPARERELTQRLEETEAAARAAARELGDLAEQATRRLAYREAQELCEVALILDPLNAKLYQRRGTTFIKVGNFVPGILDMSRALELDPSYAEEVYSKVYEISYVVDLNRVITELNTIVADHPGEAHTVFLRGYFYLSKVDFKDYGIADLEAGVADFTTCLKLNPQHVTALLYRGYLGSLLALSGDPDRREDRLLAAAADFDRAEELRPTSQLAPVLRARALASRIASEPAAAEAHRARALDLLEVAFARGYKGYERLHNDVRLDSLRDDPRFKALRKLR